jgi:hypothetical protein
MWTVLETEVSTISVVNKYVTISKVIKNEYWNMLYMINHNQARWCNDNTLDVYSECLPFKLPLVHQLSWLRFFGWFFHFFQANSWMGYDYLLPNPFQFICHSTTDNI